MANTPLAPPPPAVIPQNGNQAQLPAEAPVVLAPPDAAPGSVAGNDDRFNDLERQVMENFETRAKEKAPAVEPPVEPPAVPAPDSTGAEAGAVALSPADTSQAPVEVVPVAPAEQPPPVAGATAPVAPPTPAELPPEPLAYDPYALPAPPEQIAPVAPTQPASLPPGYIDFMGEPIPQQQAQTMRDVYQWANQLTPEESNAINAFIQQRRTAPANAPVQPAIQPVQPTQPAFPYSQPQPSQYVTPQSPGAITLPPQIDPSTVDDPAIASFLNQQSQWMAQQYAAQQQTIALQQQQLAQVQQQSEAQVQQSVSAQVAETNRQIEQAKLDFAQQYQLTAAELQVVEDRLIASGLVNSLVERRGGNIHDGLMDGFATTAWTDPTIRARLIAAETAPAVADANEIRHRAAQLGSLGGSGGSVPVQSTPASPADRNKAMVDEIRAAMNGNPS